MSSFKNERMLSAIAHAAAEFINRVSNNQSLITVTGVAFQENGKTVNIFVTVMPPEQSHTALAFLNRQRGELSSYLKKHIETRALPPTVFLPDPVMGAVENDGLA